MNYQNIIRAYNSSGLACLPTKENKAPALNLPWKDGFELEYFTDIHGIGIICGKLSGGLECIDFDNHGGEAWKTLLEYMLIKEVKTIYDKYNLPIEKTISGGYHFLYRCEKTEGNKKLASKQLNGKPDSFIETRGEGGYFCCAPTPGYTIYRNNILDIKKISPAERDILIYNAISFNEIVPIVKTENEVKDRPGDLYNSSSTSIGEMKATLQDVGWVELNDYKWRRPGKTEGISATLGKVADNIFYVFSGNAYPFEPMKAYTPFQVLALIKYNGDFKEAAKSLVPEKRTEKRKTDVRSDIPDKNYKELLLKSQVDLMKTVERPPTILGIAEDYNGIYTSKRLFTLGNFSCIFGRAKTKKTFLIMLLTSALLRNSKTGKFIGNLPEGKKNILYFDTEQGDYDSYNVMKKLTVMAQTMENFRGFALRPFSPVERCEIVEQAFLLWGKETCFCVIDGVADLANAINDEDEATRVATMLLRLTKEYNCHIVTVIHQNKKDDFATGHLGSAIMKKSEILIKVENIKGDRRISNITCDMSRSIDFDKFSIRIDDKGFPQACEFIPETVENEKPDFVDFYNKD